jgi:hypothetical protein
MESRFSRETFSGQSPLSRSQSRSSEIPTKISELMNQVDCKCFPQTNEIEAFTSLASVKLVRSNDATHSYECEMDSMIV